MVLLIAQLAMHENEICGTGNGEFSIKHGSGPINQFNSNGNLVVIRLKLNF